MEILVIAISVLFFVVASLCPVLLYRALLRNNRRHRFLIYLGLAVFLMAILTFVFGWWSDKAVCLLLSHYGYRFEAETLSGRYQNVLPQNIKEVKRLEYSYMGIAWPLKAFFAFVLFVLPYILVVYLIGFVFKKKKSAY